MMLEGEEERISVVRLERATVLHVAANETMDPDDWEVAADAWEEYGGEHDLEACFCRGMARALREKLPEYLRPIAYRRKGDLPSAFEAVVSTSGRHVITSFPETEPPPRELVSPQVSAEKGGADGG